MKNVVKNLIVFFIGFCLVNISYGMMPCNQNIPPDGDCGKVIAIEEQISGGGCDSVKHISRMHTDKGFIFRVEGKIIMGQLEGQVISWEADISPVQERLRWGYITIKGVKFRAHT